MAAGAGSRASEPLCPWGSLSFHPAPVIFPALAIGAVINVAGECDKRTEPASSVPEPLASSRPLVAHPCSWIVSSLHAQMFRGPVSGPLFSPLRGQLLPPLHHHPCRSSPIFTNFGGVQPKAHQFHQYSPILGVYSHPVVPVQVRPHRPPVLGV